MKVFFAVIATTGAFAHFELPHKDIIKPHHHGGIPYQRSPLNCTCPSNTTRNGDLCEFIEREELQSVCPPGFEQTNTTCIKISIPEDVCPYGYAFVQGNCVLRDIVPTEIACPTGYELRQPDIALYHHHHQLGSTVCVQRQTVDLELRCPDGTPFKQQCTTANQTAPQEICPPGYNTTRAGLCFREETHDCTSHAPIHPLLVKNAHLNELMEIPNGLEKLLTEIHHETSHFRNLHEIQYKPWKGKHENDQEAKIHIKNIVQTRQCTVEITVVPILICQTGTLRGNVCEVPVPVDPVFFCPAFGTVLSCFRFDRRHPVDICPANFTKQCQTKDKHDVANCFCEEITTTAPTPTCPAGSKLENGICVRTAVQIEGCPPLFQRVGDVCERVSSVPCTCSYTVSFNCQSGRC